MLAAANDSPWIESHHNATSLCAITRWFTVTESVVTVSELTRVGYLSEENDVPGWMRVDELMRYSRAFYPAWDDVYAEELRQTFGLERRDILGAVIRTIADEGRTAVLFSSHLLDEVEEVADDLTMISTTSGSSGCERRPSRT